MRASVYVGRVGGLAVALGIGMAVGGTGVAWASPADTLGSGAGADSSASAASSAAGPSARSRGGRKDRPSSTGGVARIAAAAVVSPSIGSSKVLPSALVDTDLLDADLLDTDPGAPAQSPVSWVMMGAARRDLGDRRVASPMPAAAVTTGQVLDQTDQPMQQPAANAAAPSFDQIIQYTLFHKSPTANPVQAPGRSPNGSVTGSLNAATYNGATLTYSLAQAPNSGNVVLGEDGSYAYTPNTALAAAGGTDGFSVAIDNGGPAYRLTGIGGAIQGIFSTLAQLIGLRQPDVVTVAVAVSIVGNSAPVFGTPTVGTPTGSTAVVTGLLSASDPEGGALTYGGSTNTSKGTVVIDATTGAFTYTPTPSSRGVAASTDTFTATVTDGYGASAWLDVPVTVAAWAATNPLITYSFNFTSGREYWSPEAIRALQFAADRVASYIVVSQPVTLTFDISGESSPESTTLASAGSNLAGFVFSTGYFYTVVQNKVLRGTDFNGSAADGVIEVNFGKSWSYDDTVGFSEYDLASVLMHEMMHAYGFTSAVDEPGSNTRRNWPIFASGIVDAYGVDLIDESYRFNTAFDANLIGGNGGLYFAGANAVNAYGGLVPLYTPFLWEEGSSVVHLDDYTFYNQLMTATIGTGPGVRVLSPIERGILQDMGYTMQNPIWASVVFVGFLFVRRRRVT